MLTFFNGVDVVKIVVRRHNGEMRIEAATQIAAGEHILHLVGQELMVPTRHSIQIGAGWHIDTWSTDPTVLDNAFRFLNHSCAANARVRGRDLIAVRPIAPGEQITFDYDANEWDMTSPFACACGTEHCRKLIRGYRHLDAAECKRMEPMISVHLRGMRLGSRLHSLRLAWLPLLPTLARPARTEARLYRAGVDLPIS